MKHSVVITKVNNQNVTNMTRNEIARRVVYSYTQPAVEVVMVEVEYGFQYSNSQQEPSPWEDM